MKIRILSLLHPSRIWRAWRFKRRQPPYDRAASDLELNLYASMLSGDMLHYGYFDDPGTQAASISIADMEAAQRRYADRIIEQLQPVDDGRTPLVLDAGCGMGGLTGMLLEAGAAVEALTPNARQARYVAGKHPGIKVHEMRYEDLRSENSYDTVIHSESLQYIGLEDAFRVTGDLLRNGGRWIITDYFRKSEAGISTSGHLLSDFSALAGSGAWRIVKEQDITPNIMPTLDLIRLYTDRFLLPLKHFGMEKLRMKRPFLFAWTSELRAGAEAKIEKELAAVDPERFASEKRYMLYVLERTHPGING